MSRRTVSLGCALTAVGLMMLAPAGAQAATIGFTDLATFQAAAGTTTTESFETFATGTVITNQLAGVSLVSTDGDNGSTQAQVGSISALPFAMTGGLPTSSGDRFLSSELASPIFATAGLSFDLASYHSAAGFFVVDGGPLGGFQFDLFDGATLVGGFTFGPQILPSSFVGLTSTLPFNRIVIDAVSGSDSWGIDDFTLDSTAVPEPAMLWLAGMGLAGFAGRRLGRRHPR